MEHVIAPNELRIDITCQLCHQYLCCATETTCNHTFCEGCLNEYLLYLDECPKCQAPIREHALFSNKLLDNFVLDYIGVCDNAGLEAFNSRLQRHYTFKRRTNIERSKLQPGLQVDILDKNYIWCTGKITKLDVNDSDFQIVSVWVKYDGSKKKQKLNIPTTRLAVKGSYTGRKEIPHYQRSKVVFEDNHTLIVIEDWKKDN